MATMLFDSWTMYGPGPARDVNERWKLSHLIEDMDFYGITGALVRHEQVYHYDSMFVNRMLLKELTPHRDRLFPCWVAAPHQLGDFPEPSEFIKMLEGEGIPAVCMMPERQNYPVHMDILGPLADCLNARNIPILVDIKDISDDYGEILTFCRIFKNCPVIFGNVRWANYWRLMTAVMDAFPNVFMELHKFQGNRALEVLSERYGIERLLFGSGLLRSSAGAARGFVDFSLLDGKKVDSFACGNILNLLGNKLETPARGPEGTDVIIESVTRNQPVPVTVIDAHCHVLHDNLTGIGRSYIMPGGDIANMLKLNNRTGIDLAAVMSWSGPVSRLVVQGNEAVARAVAFSPEEVVGLSTCNPVQQEEKEIRELCRNLHLKLGFRGLKPYHFADMPYTDKRYEYYWDFCNRYRLYALLHIPANSEGIADVKKLAGKYPDAFFLIAHSCSSWKFAKLVAETILKYSNIMAEITHTSVLNGIIEWMCLNAGEDRVIFGSDASMRDPRPQLGWCIYTRMDIGHKKKLVAGNFASVLQKGKLPGHSLPKVVKSALKNS